MRQKHQHSSWQVLSDILLLIVMALMIEIALLLVSVNIKQTHKESQEPAKAEYIATLTWDDSKDIDLDLWMKTPMGVIYYGNRELPNISLDRDSRGFITNKTVLPDGSSVFSGNREIIAIRAIIPGDYIIAVSYYSAQLDGISIDCNVKFEKINPVVTLIATKDCHLKDINDTINLISFRVKSDGSVENLPLPEGMSVIEEHQREPR